MAAATASIILNPSRPTWRRIFALMEALRERAVHPAVDDLPVPVLRLSRCPGCILPDGGRAHRRAVYRCVAYRHRAKSFRRNGLGGPVGDPVLPPGRRTH